MSGWGSGPWGSSAWGLGSGAAISIESARAATIRSVRVVVAAVPLADSTIILGDALDPNTWFVQDLVSGEQLTVSCVEQISSTEFEIFTFETLPGFPGLVRVGSLTLLTPGGELISPPTSADLYGLSYATPQEQAYQLLDLKNPPYDLDSQLGGTLKVDASGDFVVHTGIDVLRKLIIRRLTTSPGEFFHMPNYGIGLRVKEPLLTPDLVQLRTAIQRELLKEPEFDAVTVAITLTPDGVLKLNVKAKLVKLNTEVIIPVEVPTRLVAL